MCTFNGARFLNEQLKTIVSQDWPADEVIIIDDASTDETFAILKKWELKFSGLFKIYQNDKNLGYNRNFEKAISLCSGDLIAIADQDDIWLQDKLSSLVPLFNDQEVLLAHGASVTLKNGRLHFFSGQLNRYHLFEGNDSRRLFLLNQISGHNMMFRKSLAVSAFPLPLHLSYDWWLAVQATAAGKIKAVHRYLVYHRKHGSNTFFSKMRVHNPLSILDTMQCFRQIKGLSPDSLAFLDEFILHLNRIRENPKRYTRPYYRFLRKNSALIFGHKKRILLQLNHVLTASKFSKKW